jgi:hypothetical protein
MNFHVGLQQLSIVKSYKYLGITFDENGTFKTHEGNLMRKLESIKFYVFKLFKPNTYVSPFAIRNILKAVIMPCITYGIALWKYDRSFSQQLDRYITTILRITVRGPSTVSRDALYLEFHMLSIQYYQQYFLALFILQLLKFGDKPTLAMMCYKNELFTLEGQAIDPRMIPRENSNRHISHERALQLMAIQQRKQQRHPPNISAQLEIKVDNVEEEFDRKSYLNQLFRKFIDDVHSRQGAQMFFDVTDIDNYIENKPFYYYSQDKHVIFRIIRFRLDIAELKASVIGRHVNHAHPELLACACDKKTPETREHMLLDCPLYQAERLVLRNTLFHNGLQNYVLSLQLLLDVNLPEAQFGRLSRQFHLDIYEAIFQFITFICNKRGLL